MTTAIYLGVVVLPLVLLMGSLSRGRPAPAVPAMHTLPAVPAMRMRPVAPATTIPLRPVDKTCPDCAETVAYAEPVCPHCGFGALTMQRTG